MVEVKKMDGAEHLHEVFRDNVWLARIYIDFENGSFKTVRGCLNFADKEYVRNFMDATNRATGKES